VRQAIKNFIGAVLGYTDCYLCGNTLWREDTGDYSISPHRGRGICSRCKRDESVLIHNLWTKFYVDPVHGSLLGTTVFCNSCNKDTSYCYTFEEGKLRPVGAYCSECNKAVKLEGGD